MEFLVGLARGGRLAVHTLLRIAAPTYEPAVLHWSSSNWPPMPQPGSPCGLASVMGMELPAACRTAALLGLSVALFRPQTASTIEDMTREGIDMVLAMDLSASMLSRDFRPNRLESAKDVAMDFVDSRPFDRIGVIAYEGEAFTQVPITSDHIVVKNGISTLETGQLQGGTAIGTGLAVAVNRLRESKAASKVIVLLTDGENNAGQIEPMDAAQLAKLNNIRVYTIGVGTVGKAKAPSPSCPTASTSTIGSTSASTRTCSKAWLPSPGPLLPRHQRGQAEGDLPRNRHLGEDRIQRLEIPAKIRSVRRLDPHGVRVSHAGVSHAYHPVQICGGMKTWASLRPVLGLLLFLELLLWMAVLAGWFTATALVPSLTLHRMELAPVLMVTALLTLLMLGHLRWRHKVIRSLADAGQIDSVLPGYRMFVPTWKFFLRMALAFLDCLA